MKTITALLTAAALTLGVAPAATAAPEPALDPAKLAAAIAGLPGDEASGALLQVRGADGRWQGTSGVANVHTGQRVPHGRFRIGSMTKTFVATAALRLVARGELDLDRTGPVLCAGPAARRVPAHHHRPPAHLHLRPAVR